MRIEQIGDATLYLGDYREVSPTLPSVDAVVADPPYGCTQNNWDKSIDLHEFWNLLLPQVKSSAAICIFSQQPFTTDLIASNRKMFRYDLIWSKKKYTGFLNANRMPLRMHEIICIFYQKLPAYNPQKYYRDCPSWRNNDEKRSSRNYGLYSTKIGTGSKDGSRYPLSIVHVDYEPCFFKKTNIPQHETQKPVGIMEYLIKTYTNQQNIILDPFMGSGTTGAAAINLGRKFIGIELSPESFDIACRRIEKAWTENSLLRTA